MAFFTQCLLLILFSSCFFRGHPMRLPELIFFNYSLLNVIKLTQKIGGAVVNGSKSEIGILCLSND